MNFMLYCYVFLAGGLGVLVRFILIRFLANTVSIQFPVGVLLCNLIGSFLIGFLSWLMMVRWQFTETSQIVVLLAFLGGFTTFSAFSLDVVYLLEGGEKIKALLYTCASVIGCPLLCFMGLWFARQVAAN